jgi:replicative DNA helicase
VVALIHREEYYDRENIDLQGKANLIIAKQRNGPVGEIELHFDSKCTRFDNLAGELPKKIQEEAAIV